MKHVIVFAYVFTILLGVSALTIQWLAGKGEKKGLPQEMKLFVSLLLFMNLYDFIIFYVDNIVEGFSNDLLISFGDCLIAVIVVIWLKVENALVEKNERSVASKIVDLSGKAVAAYLIIWLIAVIFFRQQHWIRLVIDIPLICLLIGGSILQMQEGKKNGIKQSLFIYQAVTTVFMTINYVTYYVSELNVFPDVDRNMMNITIFYWLVINGANMVLLYKHDFRQTYLQESSVMNLDETMEIVKERYELTNREVEILREVYGGKSNTEIAETLYISESTVKAHIYNIFRKLKVKNRVEAVCIIREVKEKSIV